jgi:hypothetical protein
MRDPARINIESATAGVIGADHQFFRLKYRPEIGKNRLYTLFMKILMLPVAQDIRQ